MPLSITSSDGTTHVPFSKQELTPFNLLRQVIAERGETSVLNRAVDLVRCSFTQSTDTFLKLVSTQYKFQPSFEQTVFARDGRCFVTGADTDVGMSWILPSLWAHQVRILPAEPRMRDDVCG